MVNDVVGYPRSIPDKKATGKDGIFVAMLRKTLPFKLYRQISRTGFLGDAVFQSCWKSARVTTILKGGSIESIIFM